MCFLENRYIRMKIKLKLFLIHVFRFAVLLLLLLTSLEDFNTTKFLPFSLTITLILFLNLIQLDLGTIFFILLSYWKNVIEFGIDIFGRSGVILEISKILTVSLTDSQNDLMSQTILETYCFENKIPFIKTDSHVLKRFLRFTLKKFKTKNKNFFE